MLHTVWLDIQRFNWMYPSSSSSSSESPCVSHPPPHHPYVYSTTVLERKIKGFLQKHVLQLYEVATHVPYQETLSVAIASCEKLLREMDLDKHPGEATPPEEMEEMCYVEEADGSMHFNLDNTFSVQSDKASLNISST